MSIAFGIIGHGFMGHEHEAMLTDMPGIRVAAIADRDPAQLLDVREGIRRYASADELIADPEVQSVLIAANNNQHHDLVLKAARAGKHVLCEKPVAMSVAELDEMERVCRENGVTFTVHHQRRFDPDFRTIKDVYDSGTLGQVYSIQNCLYGFNGNMHDWHVFVKEGGGMLYDWGVHLLDQMLWMIDAKVNTVFADVRNVINAEVDDYFQILLRFSNGVTVEVKLGTYYLSDREKWFERHWFIAGNKETAYVDGFSPKGKLCRTTRLLTNVSVQRTMTAAGPTRSFGPPPEGVLVTEELPIACTGHRDFFENYKRALAGQEPFLVQIPQTRRVLRLMDAVRESAAAGRSVPFEE